MERTIDLFAMERRRERRNRFLRLVGMAIFAMVAMSFGAPENIITTRLGEVFTRTIPVIRYAATGILAVMFITKIVPAITGSQKESNWWEIIGIIAAVVIINSAGQVFTFITGGNASGFTF